MIWPATGFTVMANSDVDGGASSDLSAGGRWVSERSQRCGVGAAGADDPTGPIRRAPAQDQHAGGDVRPPVSGAHRLPLALPAARQLSATLDGLQHLPKFQRDGVWEAIWPELHMVLRERMGREASPSAAVLDSPSIKSAEKGAATTAKWGTTPARRSKAAKSTRGSTAKGCRCGPSFIPPPFKIATGRFGARHDPPPLPVARTDLGRWRLQCMASWQRCHGCPWRSSSGATT